MGEVDGVKGIWAYVKGGMGALTQAIAKSATGLGVEIQTGKTVKSILIKDGKASGVVLDVNQFLSIKLFLNKSKGRN
jgi:phytoene dehydrogenase-like protein